MKKQIESHFSKIVKNDLKNPTLDINMNNLRGKEVQKVKPLIRYSGLWPPLKRKLIRGPLIN